MRYYVEIYTDLESDKGQVFEFDTESESKRLYDLVVDKFPYAERGRENELIVTQLADTDDLAKFLEL